MTTKNIIAPLESVSHHMLADSAIAESFLGVKELGEYDLRFYVRNFVLHLNESLAFNTPEILQQYLDWSGSVLINRGMSVDQYFEVINRSVEFAVQGLPAEISEVCRNITEGLEFNPNSDEMCLRTFIDRNNYYGSLAAEYLEMLLQKKREEAINLIINAVDDGESIEDIYLNVLNVVLAETGRLWQMNRLNVVQEHYITAITQVAMNQLFPRIVATPKKGRRLVACCIGEELHEIGIRMVADLFELRGWDSYYVGANTPSLAVSNSISDNNPQLLAVSVTGMQFFSAVKTTIDDIRKHNDGKELLILVGGHAFNRLPAMYEKVGADLYSNDVSQALSLVEERLD